MQRKKGREMKLEEMTGLILARLSSGRCRFCKKRVKKHLSYCENCCQVYRMGWVAGKKDALNQLKTIMCVEEA